MRLPASPPRARAIAGASWTLLVIGLCAVGGEARGDCARDARHRTAIGGEVAPLELAGLLGGVETPEKAPDGPKPCIGALCSGNPATPTTAAPTTPVEVEAWGLLAGPGPIATPDSAARPDDAASPRPTHDGSSIFHPPRLPA